MTDQVEQLIKKRADMEKELRNWQQKAAVARDNEKRITKEVKEVLGTLKETFGCADIDEARELQKTLIQELTELSEEMEARLNDLRNV